ncbi:hypothetical protein DFH06DRAFT_1346720 [Mycena polygramma]|nr:hypothetical protein DFH06DRAFT_1346720 [Mycena polygramma]
MSTEKDRTRLVCVFTAPPQVSKVDFQRGFGTMMDTILALPETKNHVVKYEVSYSNTQCDGVIQVMAPIVESSGAILLVVETETPEGMQKFLADTAVIQAVQKGHPAPLGIASHSFHFSANVVTKISK